MGKRDKLKGAILACAVGNALGKGTEFMESIIVRRRYPTGLRNYSQIIQDAHRSMWAPGGYTHDVTVIMNMIRGMIQDRGQLLVRHQATILKEWYNSNSIDSSASLRSVLNQPGYLNDPLGTASRVWSSTPHLEPENDALGRALLAAMAPGDAETNAKTICALTHADPRCLGMAAIIGVIGRNLFLNGSIPTKNSLLEIAQKYHKSILPYIKVSLGGSLEQLELDDPDSMSDVRKTAAAAIWSLYHCKNATDALYRIIDAGGDADTNASLALALITLRDEGQHNLPPRLLEELEGREDLENLAESLANAWDLQ